MSYYWFCSGIRLSLDIDGTTIGSNKPFMEGGDNFSDSFYFPLFRRADEVNYESQLGDKDYVMYVIFRLGIYVN